MASFRDHSLARRIPPALLSVLLCGALLFPSGCMLLLPRDNGTSETSEVVAEDKKDKEDKEDKDDKEDQEDKKDQEDKDDTEDQDLSEESGTEDNAGSLGTINARNAENRASYEMDLTLDTKEHTIGGDVTVDVYNYSDDDWDTLCFRDYPSLFTPENSLDLELDGKITEISNIRDEDKDAELQMERSKKDASIIYFEMEEAIKPGETRQISFSFLACVPLLADRFGYVGDVYNLSNFYPVMAVYEDGDWVAHPYFSYGECFYSLVSDYHVTFHTPSDMTVACSGEETMTGDGEWSVEASSVRDICAVIGKGFEVVSEEIDGVQVNCYYTKNKKWAEIAVDAGVRAIGAFSEAFGPYPYPEIDIMQTDLFAGGMEYPSIILIYKDFEADTDPYGTLSIVVAHEIGHQWFYSLVGDDQYDEAWLDESFASYSELVYMATFMDEDEVEEEADGIQGMMGGDDFTDMEDALRLNRPYDDFDDDNSYVMTAYYYGEIFLYRLREAMGDEDFTLMMQAYVKEFSHEVATTKDFVDYVRLYAGDNDEVEELLAIFLPGVE